MLPNVLQIFSFSQDRGLIEDGAFGPQAEEADIIMLKMPFLARISSRYSAMTWVCWHCQSTCAMTKHISANYKWRVGMTLGLTSMQHVLD